MELLPMAGIALKNLFSRPATRLYPKVVRPPFAGNRGHIEIDFSACILCGMCARRCPAHAIAVDRAKGEWKIDRLSCVICSGCVSVCPKKCLSLRPERSAVTAALKKIDGTELHIREAQAPAAGTATAPTASASPAAKPADKGDARGA
jgi:ech hydrogenase subunit F